MADKGAKAASGAASGAAMGTAIMPGWGTAIGAGLGLIGGMLGPEGDGGEAHNQAVIAKNIIDSIANAPEISKPLLLEQYRQQGLLTPEMEEQVQVGISKASQAKGSQQATDAQMDALQQIQQRSHGGLTAEDRAALNKIHQEVGASTQGQRGAIMQQMRAQGQGGSGAELAAQLAAAQAGANTESEQGDRLAAMASQNALQAAGMTGNLAGQIQGQQFGQQYQTGQAADAFRQFDVGNQINQQQRNVGAQNTAQANNLANAQSVSNANVAQQNQELNNQLQRQMQQYTSDLNLAKLKSGAHAQMGGVEQGLNEDVAQGKANTGGGLATIGAALPSIFGAGGSTPAAKWDGGEIKDFRSGGKVPGEAMHPGDHPANDTVPAMLSPGEIVIPRSMAKTGMGKRLAKLLEDHHQLRKDMGE